MPRQHVVLQGEHISAIAARYGFARDEAIWSHPDNAELKNKRTSPHILAPGDVLTIPDRETREVEVSTGRMHRFVVRRTSLELAVRLLDWQMAPIPGKACKLTVDGVEEELTSDGDGVLRRTISRDAQAAWLEVGEARFDLAIGHLDPLEETTGLQARLNALGYWAGEPGDGDDEQLGFAVELFQHDHGLDVDGAPGPALLSAIEEAFGC